MLNINSGSSILPFLLIFSVISFSSSSLLERYPRDLKELVIRKTLTKFLLIISVWTGLNTGKEDERDVSRLQLDDADDATEDADDDKDLKLYIWLAAGRDVSTYYHMRANALIFLLWTRFSCIRSFKSSAWKFGCCKIIFTKIYLILKKVLWVVRKAKERWLL